MNYVAPRWLPGGNLQTIWSALYARKVQGALPRYRRERWTTPDADFIDVDYLGDAAAHGRPLLVLFHGLEGSSVSHYALAFADLAREHGLAYAVPHFRQSHAGPIVVVGVSLGGNALLRWAQELGTAAAQVVSAVATVSAPMDLAAGGHAIGKGLNRLVYTRMFLNSMKPKALRKLAQHPGLFDRDALQQARSLYEFDNVFTAPLHGFRNTDDYWQRASAKPHLHQIRVPALVVNALNDPFVPAASLPMQSDVGSHVTLWQPNHGGHVGFVQGSLPGHLRCVPDAVGGWLLQHTHRSPEYRHG